MLNPDGWTWDPLELAACLLDVPVNEMMPATVILDVLTIDLAHPRWFGDRKRIDKKTKPWDKINCSERLDR